ncbi:MAG: terminase small subunit [Candidatus Sulfotelmatobacter sp.]
MLTKKKRAFIANYCEDPKCNQAEAARKAGCSLKRAKQTAYEFMRDPEVKREIDRQLAIKVDRVEVLVKTEKLTAERVINDLEDIEEMCKVAGPGAWQASTLVKIAELKGKYLKMWTDRLELDVDEKLIARLEAGRRNAGLNVPQLPTPTIEPAAEEKTEAEIIDPKKDTIQ